MIDANKNRIYFEDGESIPYDALAVNVGSRTRGANEVSGVNEFSLTTRPINDLLGKIEVKEAQLIKDNITPSIAVCGAGAAGIEMAFAFKHRWSKLFGKDIKTTLLSNDEDIMLHQSLAAREMVKLKLKENGVEVINKARVSNIQADGIHLKDGRTVVCNVPVWATGAEAQKVTDRSNLAMLDNYFRVNDFLQSTSHPNVFAGGDCIQMESYSHTVHPGLPKATFPPKAGVYAVREGPFIAQNIVSYLLGADNNRPLLKYVPQTGFLALLMTGDGKAIGTKFGIAFSGKWVWNMKTYIDVGFMKLFDPNYLY